MWELYDDKTDKIVFVGTEEECEEYSKHYPERKFYMIEVKKPKKPK